jgi:putative glutamine amidotransferase
MKRPVIGITVDRVNARPDLYESPFYYAAAVERAGGVPVLLAFRTDVSLVPQIVDLLDGLLLSGGDDPDPSIWGEEWHPRAVPTDPARTKFELALLGEVEKRRLPALGICFGSQLMNIYRGGTLHQFLPDLERTGAVEHRRVEEKWGAHPVELRPGSIVAEMLGRTGVLTNSAHKQAVRELGRGLRIIGTAPDGVVEGVEDPSLPLFLGVQWHPERLVDEVEHMALFRLLVEKAGQK